jgi:MFS family permease
MDITCLKMVESEAHEPSALQPLLDRRPQNSKKTLKLTVLTIINIFNYSDRYVISSLLIDIQDYFGIDDTLAGFLQTVYLLSFTLVLPIFGYIGDRYAKKHLVLFSLVVWSASLLSGAYVGQRHFPLFMLTRSLFGVASAAFICVGMPIIADLYDDESDNTKRTRALLLYFCGPCVGSGLGFFIGFLTSELFESAEWQFALKLSPMLLIFAFCVVLAFFDTEAYQSKGVIDITRRKPTFLMDLKDLLGNKEFLLLTTANCFCLTCLVGFNWWIPSYNVFLFKSKFSAVDLNDMKLVYSILTCVAGTFGIVSSSFLSNFYQNKTDSLVLAAGLYASSISLYVYLTLTSENIYLDAFFYSIFVIFINFVWILVSNLILLCVKPRLRSTANAFMLFVLHLFGDSLSPLWLGFVNDFCFTVSFRRLDTFFVRFKCIQTSLFILVFILFFAATFALFSSFFKKPSQEYD